MTTTEAASQVEVPGELKIARRHHPLRWLVALVLSWVTIGIVRAFATTPNIDWTTVRSYLFNSEVIAGLERTLLLTAAAMALAVVLGVLLAVMRLSDNPVARSFAIGYVWLMRSVPVLVQLIFWYNLALVFQRVTMGVPGTGIDLVNASTNSVITPFMAAVFGLGLAEAAYYSEIVRGGLLGVGSGQRQAASAIGMTGFQSFRLIILPQAMRIIIPPTGNEFIGMLKYTALASVISYDELLGTSQQIYGQNGKTIELLLVISLWYVVCTTVFSIIQFFIERHFRRGYARVNDARPARAFGFLKGRPAEQGDAA
jgi:polar amino acid transport system permease protein